MTSTHIIIIASGALVAIIFIYFLTRRGYNHNAAKAAPSVVKGLAALYNGDDKNALEELRALALADKGSPEIYISIGFLYRKLGNITKAIHIHEILLGNSDIDDEYKPFILTELAKDYLEANIPDKAIAIINGTAGANKNPENVIILAKAYFAAGDYDNAASYYTKYTKLTGTTIKGFYCKCLIAKAKTAKDIQGATKAVKAATDYDNYCRPARFVLAAIFKSEGKHTKAMNEYKSIITDNLIRDEEDLKKIQAAFIEAGEEASLKSILESHVSTGTKNPLIAVHLANYYADEGNTDRGVELLKLYLSNTGYNIYAAKNYARLADDKVLQEAIKNDKPFICNQCGTEYDDYHDECHICTSFDCISLKRAV